MNKQHPSRYFGHHYWQPPTFKLSFGKEPFRSPHFQLFYFKDEAAVVEDKQESSPEPAPSTEETVTPAQEEPKQEEVVAAPVQESNAESQPVSFSFNILAAAL